MASHWLNWCHILKIPELVSPVFKLTDLVTLYSTRLEQLGTKVLTPPSSKTEFWATFWTWRCTSKAEIQLLFPMQMLEVL